ncbi:hypothetical protein [Pseudomonas sp. PD9R]|uniref:hypothetical protein n=1 Tax=Pseudomonas sp. PD9R TaxID=2853534 RepID=UPI001C446654|nr:hypothetical protein [Pseudomonas sp. PD9R]MBV6825317.1 hypothetical protein [Pseudomonas sp. PD9R]
MELKTLFFATAMGLPTSYAAAESDPLDGHYYLHGAMEMGAELLLRKDGAFAGGIAYGSAGGNAKGTWHAETNTVTLTTDPASRPPKEMQFSPRGHRNIEDFEADLPHDKFFEPVRDNYVVQMTYSRPPMSSDFKPVYAYFEFTHGPSSQVLLSSATPGKFWLPYDPQRALKKIGFGTSEHSGPTSWYDVLPTTRSLIIGWSKPKNQPISFEISEEMNLFAAQRFLRNNPDATERLKNNYPLWLSYDVIPPNIKPIDLYWQFKDGSTQQTVWADSSQTLLTLPFDTTRTLQNIGMRPQGSTTAIQWFAVVPSDRWLYFGWDLVANENENNLGVLFDDLQLAIEPNCLAADFGSGKACFRRR